MGYMLVQQSRVYRTQRTEIELLLKKMDSREKTCVGPYSEALGLICIKVCHYHRLFIKLSYIRLSHRIKMSLTSGPVNGVSDNTSYFLTALCLGRPGGF